jgi:hypothetical protein
MKQFEEKFRNYCMSASLALAFIFPLGAEARTLYVNGSTGNDATSYANNNESNPWRTIGRAAWGNTSRSAPNTAEAARAGDTVLVAAGTYNDTTNTGSSYAVIYNPANAGTAGSPISFEAVGTVTLTLSGGGAGVLIGAYSKNYINWKGFTINEANAPSYGNTGVAAYFSSTGGVIENCVLDGNGDPGHGDNHPGIRLESAFGQIVRNNIIRNFRTSVVNANNGAGIQVYNSYNLTITHNEIYNNGSGIFFKELIANPTGTTVVRYNLIRNNGQAGIAIHRMVSGHAYHIAQNVIYGNNEGVTFWGFDGSSFPRNTSVVNNTISSNVYMGVNVKFPLQPSAGNKVYGNIFYNEAVGIFSETADIANVGDRTKLDANHNVYYSVSSTARLNGAPYSLSTWQSMGQDSVNPVATTSNPLFVNAAVHNYKLQPGSPYLAQSVDILDLDSDGSNSNNIPAGAYITGNEVIGVLSGSSGSDVTPPSPPTNLQVR